MAKARDGLPALMDAIVSSEPLPASYRPMAP